MVARSAAMCYDEEGLEGHTYTQVRQLYLLSAGAALPIREFANSPGEEEALCSLRSQGMSVNM